jgi:1-acyl-sn-glycerol-3-phosphate acyltransferase
MRLYRAVRAVAGPVVRAVWGARAEGAWLPPGPIVVVSNHESLLDPFLLGAALDRPLRFVAKEELWANRLVGGVLEWLGGIPVRRGRGDLDAMVAAALALADGDAVAIFPQGTVLGSGGRPWLRGAARLALGTGAPIVPVRILGAERALRPGTRLPRRARVRVVVGEPIHVERAKATIAAARDLTATVRTTIEALS